MAMATASQQVSGLDAPNVDDMEISSDFGRADDIEIDLDLDGDHLGENSDAYMLDDATMNEEPRGDGNKDQLMLDEFLDHDEDGIMHDDATVVDEHLTDASEIASEDATLIIHEPEVANVLLEFTQTEKQRDEDVAITQDLTEHQEQGPVTDGPEQEITWSTLDTESTNLDVEVVATQDPIGSPGQGHIADLPAQNIDWDNLDVVDTNDAAGSLDQGRVTDKPAQEINWDDLDTTSTKPDDLDVAVSHDTGDNDPGQPDDLLVQEITYTDMDEPDSTQPNLGSQHQQDANKLENGSAQYEDTLSYEDPPQTGAEDLLTAEPTSHIPVLAPLETQVFSAESDLDLQNITQSAPQATESTNTSPGATGSNHSEIEQIDDRKHMHPVSVFFQDNDFALVQSPSQESSELFFLQDTSTVYEPIKDLLQEFRQALGQEVSDDVELELRIDSLGLYISEDSTHALTTTFSDVLDVFLQLNQQSGNHSPGPLYVTLTTRPSFQARLNQLYQAAGVGRSASQLDSIGSSGNDKTTENHGESHSQEVINKSPTAQDFSHPEESDPFAPVPAIPDTDGSPSPADADNNSTNAAEDTMVMPQSEDAVTEPTANPIISAKDQPIDENSKQELNNEEPQTEVVDSQLTNPTRSVSTQLIDNSAPEETNHNELDVEAEFIIDLGNGADGTGEAEVLDKQSSRSSTLQADEDEINYDDAEDNELYQLEDESENHVDKSRQESHELVELDTVYHEEEEHQFGGEEEYSGETGESYKEDEEYLAEGEYQGQVEGDNGADLDHEGTGEYHQEEVNLDYPEDSVEPEFTSNGLDPIRDTSAPQGEVEEEFGEEYDLVDYNEESSKEAAQRDHQAELQNYSPQRKRNWVEEVGLDGEPNTTGTKRVRAE